MRRAFSSLFDYSIRPVYLETNERMGAGVAFRMWWTMFGLYLILSLLTAALVSGLGVFPDNHEKAALQFTPFVNFCIIAILGPLLEEAAFRLPLRAGKYLFLVASTVMTYFVSTNFFYHTRNYDLGHDFPDRVALSMAVGLLVFLLAGKWEARLIDFWKRHFRAIYYGMALLFAYMHLVNFNLPEMPWYALPFATLPQLISSFILGYARMHYGFRFSFLLHSGFNGIPELLFGPLMYAVFHH